MATERFASFDRDVNQYDSREAHKSERIGKKYQWLTVTEIDHLRNFTGVVRDITERKVLQKQLLEIVSEEQRRIGQELHDGIGQEVTGLTLLAGTIKRLLPDLITASGIDPSKYDPSVILSAANQLVEGLSETNRHLKDLSHGIMPVQIDIGSDANTIK